MLLTHGRPTPLISHVSIAGGGRGVGLTFERGVGLNSGVDFLGPPKVALIILGWVSVSGLRAVRVWVLCFPNAIKTRSRAGGWRGWEGVRVKRMPTPAMISARHSPVYFESRATSASGLWI